MKSSIKRVPAKAGTLVFLQWDIVSCHGWLVLVWSEVELSPLVKRSPLVSKMID